MNASLFYMHSSFSTRAFTLLTQVFTFLSRVFAVLTQVFTTLTRVFTLLTHKTTTLPNKQPENHQADRNQHKQNHQQLQSFHPSISPSASYFQIDREDRLHSSRQYTRSPAIYVSRTRACPISISSISRISSSMTIKSAWKPGFNCPTSLIRVISCALFV